MVRSGEHRRSTEPSCSPPGGGDYPPYLGQGLSVGYLAHDAERIELYLEESLTFMAHSAETGIALIGDTV